MVSELKRLADLHMCRPIQCNSLLLMQNLNSKLTLFSASSSIALWCRRWLQTLFSGQFDVFQALSAGWQNRSPKPDPVAQEQELGYFLETGLQRAHVIHFKNG